MLKLRSAQLLIVKKPNLFKYVCMCVYVLYACMDVCMQGFIQRGVNWDSPPPVPHPPKEFEKIYYYRKISSMMINTNFVNCS